MDEDENKNEDEDIDIDIDEDMDENENENENMDENENEDMDKNMDKDMDKDIDENEDENMDENMDEDEDADEGIDKDIWISFGKWLGIEKLPIKKKVKKVIKNKWRKLQHGLIYQNNQDIVLDINTIGDDFKCKNNLIKSANENNNTLDKLKNYYYLTKSECIVDQNNQTLIHLDSINNNNAILQATKAVNDYYFHTLENPSHRSDSFWDDMAEHFGAYRTYNQFPYISAEMASSHNQNHLECVNKLIIALEPLSNCVNQFVKENYNNLYTFFLGSICTKIFWNFSNDCY